MRRVKYEYIITSKLVIATKGTRSTRSKRKKKKNRISLSLTFPFYIIWLFSAFLRTDYWHLLSIFADIYFYMSCVLFCSPFLFVRYFPYFYSGFIFTTTLNFKFVRRFLLLFLFFLVFFFMLFYLSLHYGSGSVVSCSIRASIVIFRTHAWAHMRTHTSINAHKHTHTYASTHDLRLRTHICGVLIFFASLML